MQITEEKFYICAPEMEVVAQLVRASDCGSEGRGFEPRLPPNVLLRTGTYPDSQQWSGFFLPLFEIVEYEKISFCFLPLIIFCLSTFG